MIQLLSFGQKIKLKKVSWIELRNQVSAVANYLKKKVLKLEIVAAYLPNMPETI